MQDFHPPLPAPHEPYMHDNVDSVKNQWIGMQQDYMNFSNCQTVFIHRKQHVIFTFKFHPPQPRESRVAGQRNANFNM